MQYKTFMLPALDHFQAGALQKTEFVSFVLDQYVGQDLVNLKWKIFQNLLSNCGGGESTCLVLIPLQIILNGGVQFAIGKKLVYNSTYENNYYL